MASLFLHLHLPLSRPGISRIRACSCVFWTLLWLYGMGSASAQTPLLPAHRVVVLLVPGFRAEDLTRVDMPGLATLRAEGAAGWMICRAARSSDRNLLLPDGRDTPASLALTLGSGARVLAGGRRGEKEKRRKGEETELQGTGNREQGTEETQSAIENRKSKIGGLGDLIHAKDWHTIVCGNADTDVVDDEGTLLAADSAGKVDLLHTEALIDTKSMFAPYGKRDNIPALCRALSTASKRDALVTLVFGDLARADAYGALCLPAQRDIHHLAALRSLDELLTTLHSQMQVAPGPPIRFFLLSPAPAASADLHDRLAPILMWGRDVRAGILTSPSTRLSGIVVNTDFLPSLAEAFGVAPPAGTIGRAFQAQPMRNANTLTDWQAAHDQILQSERLKDVYGGLPTLQMLLVIAALGCFYRQLYRFACSLVTAIAALPLALLLLPSLPFAAASVISAGFAITIFLLTFSLTAWRLYPSRRGVPFLLAMLFTVLLGVLALDLLTGSHLLRQAWMSYSVMEAARFYGIGNEYMGVMIGTACIVLGRSGKRRKEKGKSTSAPHASDLNEQQYASKTGQYAFPFLLFCFFAFLLLILLGYNRFGAKVGAIPSAGMALGVEGLMLWRGRLRARDLLLIGGAALLVLAGLLLLDMRHGMGEQSHFARAFAGSGGSLPAIALRKLRLECYLLLHSPWSAALLAASLGFFVVVTGRGKEEKKRRREEEKTEDRRQKTEADALSTINYHLSTIYGLVTGAVASLLCNDSGVTAAAMIMLFAFAWALAQEADGRRFVVSPVIPSASAGGASEAID